jgi:hypothetical protein
MTDYITNNFRQKYSVLFVQDTEFIMLHFASFAFWVVSHNLTTSTEEETLCHVHFAVDFEIILF